MTPKIRYPLASDRKPVPTAASDEFAELADLAFLLDSRWRIPVIGVRFGVDAVAGLLPVVGDLAAAAISASIVHRAYKLGAPRRLVFQMAGNVLLDTAIGSIPIAGTLFDVVFKANKINVGLLRGHLEDSRARDTANPKGQ